MNMAGGPGIFSESARFSLGEMAGTGAQSPRVAFSSRGRYVYIRLTSCRLWRDCGVLTYHRYHISSISSSISSSSISGIIHGPLKVRNSVVEVFYFFFFLQTQTHWDKGPCMIHDDDGDDDDDDDVR